MIVLTMHLYFLCSAIDGKWASWSEMGTCSETCGGGLRLRVRYCDNPAPMNGGRMCAKANGDQDDKQVDMSSCNSNPCPSKICQFFFFFF